MSDTTPSASLRVITLNLWGQQGNWKAHRSVLIDGLRKLNPDLVAFQEALKTETDDQTVDLLGPGYHGVRDPLSMEHQIIKPVNAQATRRVPAPA